MSNAFSYNKINEDFLDDQQIDITDDNSAVRPEELFDGTYKYPYVFKFIVTNDFSKYTHDEYVQSIVRFFDILQEMFDKCPYIKNYDKFRVVNTISFYYTGHIVKYTESGLQFTAESLQQPKNIPWFNTSISFDCRNDIVGIIRTVSYLYRSLSIAAKQAFKKVKSYTLIYRAEDNKDYQYPGSIQLSSGKKDEEKHRLVWQSLSSLDTRYSSDLSTLLDAMLAFFPTNSVKQIRQYQKEIMKLFKIDTVYAWYITHRDKQGLSRVIEFK